MTNTYSARLNIFVNSWALSTLALAPDRRRDTILSDLTLSLQPGLTCLSIDDCTLFADKIPETVLDMSSRITVRSTTEPITHPKFSWLTYGRDSDRLTILLVVHSPALIYIVNPFIEVIITIASEN
jgi:hypothetical protein